VFIHKVFILGSNATEEDAHAHAHACHQRCRMQDQWRMTGHGQQESGRHCSETSCKS
jgi:hypothetical protein